MFLEKYDKERNGKRNGVIDVNELTDPKARTEFVNDLSQENKEEGGGSKLGDIILAIKELEERIIRCRHGTLYDTNEEVQIVVDNQQDEVQNQVEVSPNQRN